MLGWSERRNFYEHPLSKSANKIGSKTVCVKFCINDDGDVVPTESTKNPFKNIVSHNDFGQHAIVTGLYSKFIQNDFSANDTEIKITNLFDPNLDNDEDNVKSDYIIPCPARYHGLFEGSDELIYKPNGLTKEEILLYAGQERNLFEPTVTELVVNELSPIGSLFEDTHPLICCLTSERFDTSILKKITEKKTTYYGVKDDAMERMKVYFETKVCSHINYTRFEECQLECNLKGVENVNKHDGIVLLLQINYILSELK